VRGAGWSTPTRAPARTAGVPEGALPVGSRLGRAQEAVQLRLSGTGSTLELAVVTAPGATFGTPAVRVCPLTTADWRPGRPGPAVPHDDADCVPAVVEGGVLRADLSRYADRTSDRGFALLADLSADAATALRTFRLSVSAPSPTAGAAP
jgi:hypothetical protein